MKISSFGTSENTDCKGIITARDPFLKIEWSAGQLKGSVNTMLYGDYNFENVMAAVCTGMYFGINPEQIDHAINNYTPDNNRSQWKHTGRNTLLMDAYNANPSSMKAAIVNFRQLDTDSKVIILGDMMELGMYTSEEHRNIVNLVRESAFDQVFFIGELFSEAAKGGNEICFGDESEAKAWFRDHPVDNRMILLKGSRKMKLENLGSIF
jgi:UDP-N-acetylmuramoyl-tripeptide--D-alanyl-D-alanine ligase